MLTKEKIPFINENFSMKNALKIISQKKLGILIARNNQGNTTGIITDGQIRRVSQKHSNLHDLKVKKVMTRNPIKVEKEMLALKALSIMNDNKITSLCVISGSRKNKTIGIIHIHSILENTIA
jgi:arabinose-5-phosphate isomerase